MTTTTNLTAADLDRMSSDDRWLGFGYIGGRNNAIAEGWNVADADTLVLEMGQGMTYDELFAWANSKNGRWFAVSAHVSR